MSSFLALSTLLGAAAFTAAVIAGADGGAGLPLPAQDRRAQLHPDIAFDGSETYLLVWQQGRQYYQGQAADLFAIRLDGAGRPIDESPFPVCNHAGSQERPRVTFSQGNFFVVWQDFRNGHDWDVYAARITPDGERLDDQGVALASAEGNESNPTVSEAPDGALVLWEQAETHGLYKVYGSLLDSSGRAAAPQPLRTDRGSAARWYGYTPGFGFSDEPLTDPPRDIDHLRGGRIALSSYRDGWLLSWDDESNWGVGFPNLVTRRFGRLTRVDGDLRVSGVARAPTPPVGQRQGIFATGPKLTLYFSAGVAGRSKRVATAVAFRTDGAIVANPNRDPKRLGSGWDPSHTALAFEPSTPVGGPVAASYSAGRYVVIAAGDPKSRPPNHLRLYLREFSDDGIRSESTVVAYQAARPPANPVLAPTPDGVLLAFEEPDETGQRRIRVKLVKTN